MSRISYRNFPILQKIKNRKLGVIPILAIDKDIFKEINPILKEVFEKQAIYFEKNIISVSKKFLETMNSAGDKLVKIANDEVFGDNDFIESGTIIAGNSVIMFCIYATKDEYLCTIWKTDKNGIFDYFYYNADQEMNFSSSKYGFKNNQDNKDMGIFIHSMVIQILMFKKYANVEVIDSKAKSKTNQFGCKYLNETDLNIQYLDSKWFTTLVNSTGFKVRGFFRLQPKKKDGEWTKELIWIDEFEKKGYNRQAKILNNNIV